MNLRRLLRTFLTALTVCCSLGNFASAAESLRKAPSDISPPLPKTGAVRISVLLVGGQNNHNWQLTNEFLVTLLKRYPAFDVVESNTPSKGAPASEWDSWNPQFDRYQCVILDYNGEDWPGRVQTAFEDYVAKGGAVMCIHAANNSFTGWKAFEQMVGLLWRGTNFGASLYMDDGGSVVREEKGKGRSMGHGSQWDFALTVRDPKHPITAGMPPVWKHVKDELYHGQRGPAENINILLTAFDDPKQGGLGKHEPIVWWTPYGKGKVLTNVMGHVSESSAPLSCVGFQTVLLRSIEWLATGNCTTPIPPDFPNAERTSQRYPGTAPKVPFQDLAPLKSLSSFKLPKGYHLELVASEPMIVNPVMCTWDGNGRMFVAEMTTYMKDADGTGEKDPVSRVSMLSDTNGDGVMDRATVFAKNLVLPRMIVPLDDRVIVAETYSGKFVSYRDTNGDGIADEQKEVFSDGPTSANLEHQDSALTWGIDNYLYTAQKLGNRRIRINGESWQSEPVFGASSQWGLAMDDLGRMFGSAAGAEKPAYGFQQYPSYGALALPGETDAAFDEVFPAVQTLDLQGGLGRIHNIKGTLNHFTACCGQSIFRGDRLPRDLYGDLILPEPAGRLVRRAKVGVHEGKRILSNAYPGDEFITSTDLAFRPVWSGTGPDGCLYIVDLHNGIVQESAWVTPGSYLRDTILREGYDKHAGRGRIYRLVADGMARGPKPDMLRESSNQLVAHLSHPNGWWRDTAQKLLVLRGDKSVVPKLQALAQSDPAPLGRVHALWTLDGLNATDRSVLIHCFSDSDERVRATAVRISEAFLRKGDTEFIGLLKRLLSDPSIDVVVQAINSLRYVPGGVAKPLIQSAVTSHLGNEIITASAQQSFQFDPVNPRGITVGIDPAGLALMKKGREHYTELCFACHGPDGRGVETSDKVLLAPPLAGSARVLGSPEALVRIVLNGLVGEIDGRSYPGAMVPQKANDDIWIAEVLTYVRNSFGNTAPAITAGSVAAIRKAAGESPPHTLKELAPYLSIPRDVMSRWAWSASHNSKEANRAIDGDPKSRWSTNTSREVGQWFQVDMGKPFEITRIVMDTTGSNGDFPKKFEIRTSDDGNVWSEPITAGNGSTVLTLDFQKHPVTRFLRIIQNTKEGGFWSIHEFSMYGAEAK